ncbi:hypothetical protein [Thalassospira mesophila]|uniref:Uncharacterized protein n=1 Tax=Thalassospira mesophila TaxID=1293891 RepID=A0A1Y2L486_9PROT|nr:hypothetical protein [Thalassospira mesophila]OSQ40644.1 hypothetical protein TMES_02610 [Thalassospira mesophila]
MYQPRTPGYSKRDAIKRWQLPDRVFFACGACHILAYAFVERHGDTNAALFTPLWIKPDSGFTGNHIVIAGDDWIFDYHGYSRRSDYLNHTLKRAQQRWPGWNATLVSLPPEILISEEKSREIDGLWLRAPNQFLHDALPRARQFLNSFTSPPYRPKEGTNNA